MSEQTIQDDLYSSPVTIMDKYTCLSLGATTINDLVRSGKLSGVRVSKNLGKKPDVLIIDRDRHVIIFLEFKKPAEFSTEAKINKAIKQEINVAREVNARIYVVSDGETFIWINPLTGNRICDDSGKEVRRKISPKEEQKKLAAYIERVIFSISATNDTVLKIEDIDPTDLAVKIGAILKKMTFATSKMSLYTFVEVFLFKYLSDIGILTGQNSFEYINSLYKSDDPAITNADILGKYLEGPREQMKMLSPAGPDGTSIVNGQIFHAEKDVKTGHYLEEDSHAVCFEQIIKEFAKYEKKNGKFINISRDFKSKLFETFMKNSDDKSDMGQFFTPLKIVTEMVRMVPVFSGAMICDPASGVGKFLLEAAVNAPDEYEVVRTKDGKPESLKKSVTLFGYEKQMSGNDDITTILAKANMLIYFSKLFRENNDADSVMFLSSQLLNTSFFSSRTALGTLERHDVDMYDIFLANPPYYQDATISRLAKDTGHYTTNAQGVEGLFLEWIVRALKSGGIANVVIPDGILTNSGNDGLKSFILQNCYIESIISLPINSFFNTNKKTFILTLRKKTKSDIEAQKTQDYKVFTYICSSIGETLDTYRRDIDDNDLHEAVNKYNQYHGLSDRNCIDEPFLSWFKNDKRMKLVDISQFDNFRCWNIDDNWTDEEKIELGIKKASHSVSSDDFGKHLREISITTQRLYDEFAQCDTIPENIQYADVKITELFTPMNGNSKYTKTWCAEHPGEYPIYSGNTSGPYDYISEYDYDGEYLTWAKDGLAGYIMYHNEKFSLTGHRGILIPTPKCKNIDLMYVKYMLEPIFRNAKKGRQGDNGKNEYTTLNKEMIQSMSETIRIPIDNNGQYDLKVQKLMSKKYMQIDYIKAQVNNMSEELSELTIR